jgi:chromosome segregation ATPase
MADYNYNKNYKNLDAQKSSMEKDFKELFENDSRKDQMLAWLEGYKKTHEDILEMADEEISDVEWDKDQEIDDLTTEIRGLENKIEELEEKYDSFDVKSLEDEMKLELFQAAMKKYTLVQLEEKLGNRFELI